MKRARAEEARAEHRARGGRSHPAGTGREEGFAMVFVIFVIMVVGILGAVVLLYTAYALRSAVGVTPAARAQSVAEAGIEAAHAMLASEQITDTTVDPIRHEMFEGKGEYSVSVVKDPELGDGDPYDWLITSRGQYTAEVEGVERTFYRTLQEVVTFAGGRYYNALNYVLFSKEGSIDINLGGSMLQVGGVTIDGDIYAGQDINLSNAAVNKVLKMSTLTVSGDMVTERGDINVYASSKGATADIATSSVVNINGSLYGGILAAPGDVGGGVDLAAEHDAINYSQITVTGDVNASGRLRDSNYGIRLYNGALFAANCTITVNGQMRSARSIRAFNEMLAIAGSRINVLGSMHSGGNVEIASTLGGLGSMGNTVSGSIYAAGDVSLQDSGAVAGELFSQVGGGIQAGGDVSISNRFILGCSGASGTSIGGSIYGRNINIDFRNDAVGGMANSVGSNIYAAGTVSLSNYAGPAATVTTNINGSVYSNGNIDAICRAMGAWIIIWVKGVSRVFVKGASSLLNPPNLGGGFSRNGEMSLTAQEGGGFLGSRDEAVLSVQPNARDDDAAGPTISEINGGDVQTGVVTPPVQFALPPPLEPESPTSYNEVLLPSCDFDYYRELAKEQESLDGQDHYFETPQPDLDIGSGAFSSSLYVVFVEGDLGIGTVGVPVNCKAVFVATGNITLREELKTEGAGNAQYQIIAGEKFLYDTGSNLSVNDGDYFFIYAAHNSYDPVTDPLSVEYEMGWFKNLHGQITARGDIELNSQGSYFSWLPLYNYSIHYVSPSVLGEAFRIPFTVKSWKEL